MLISHLSVSLGWRKKTVSLGWRKKNLGKNMDRRSLRKRAVKHVSSVFDSFQDELQACGAAENAKVSICNSAEYKIRVTREKFLTLKMILRVMMT